MASLTSCEILSWKTLRSPATIFSNKGRRVGLPDLTLSLDPSKKIQKIEADLRKKERHGKAGRNRRPMRLKATAEGFSSPKTGTVGADRFKDGAISGTYWSESVDLAEEVAVHFNTGTKSVTVNCRAGENLLKVAEGCGAMIPNLDFCFEGTCCHCEMEVEGGAVEVGYRADTSGSDLIRSCICPVPKGRETVHVNILSEEDAWGDGVL